jgi:hypothetical protein
MPNSEDLSLRAYRRVCTCWACACAVMVALLARRREWLSHMPMLSINAVPAGTVSSTTAASGGEMTSMAAALCSSSTPSCTPCSEMRCAATTRTQRLRQEEWSCQLELRVWYFKNQSCLCLGLSARLGRDARAHLDGVAHLLRVVLEILLKLGRVMDVEERRVLPPPPGRYTVTYIASTRQISQLKACTLRAGSQGSGARWGGERVSTRYL